MNPTQSEPTPPKVSVILPSFNSIAALRRALAALEASDARESMEILVMDGGSRDGTAAIDQEFSHVTMMRQPRYFGATKLRNIGVRTAKGEFVLFLAPSVEVKPATVRLLAEALEAHPEWGAVCPMVCDAAGRPARQLHPLPGPKNLGEGAAGNWQLRPAAEGEGAAEVDNPSFKAFLARRQSIAGMSYFDEQFGEFWSDADYCYKLRKAGKKLMVLRDVTVTENEAGVWLPSPKVAAAFAADRALGAARFAGKHFSGLMGAQMTAGTLLRALASLQFGAFMRIVGGQKIDGAEVVN
jgi:GT2 family glycosyltransferase